MNVLITGCGKGVGFELVHAFLELGEVKIICVSQNLKFLKDSLSKDQIIRCEFIEADITTEIFFDKLSVSLEKIKNIDILINNAGILIKNDFIEFKESDLRRIFEVNYFSVFKLIQYIVPYFGKSKIKHIVNITSMGGFQGSVKFSGLSVYSSSKAALSCLTESLAVELSDKEIKVNALALGAVNTQMLKSAFPGYNALNTPKQMAKFILDFAVNSSQFINGKIIPVSLTTP